MIDKSRGLALLGSGLGPTDVAQTLGCDPSLISQWLMDDDFRSQVLAERIKNLTAHTARDRKIDTIEDALITKLEDTVPYMTKAREILQAFNIVNAAKRRGAQASGAINVTQNIVSINLPPTAKEYFFPKTNAQGEVVQVGDKVTVTKSLQQLMQERMNKKLTAQDAQVINETSNARAAGTRSTGSRETETST